MNIKQRLRIILYSYSFTTIVIYTIKLLCGKLSSIGKITLCICYGMIAFLLIYILLIILKIEFVGKKLLELGELLISNKLTSKNNKIKLKEMMKKTKKLMTEVKP